MILRRNYRPECESWPDCNCGRACEVERILNVKRGWGAFEYCSLAWLLIGTCALLYLGWPS